MSLHYLAAFLVLFGLTTGLRPTQEHLREQDFHLKNPPRGQTSPKDLRYFTTDVEDYDHFDDVLDRLLIVRVPDTPGIERARKVIVDEMESLNWAIQYDEFINSTPKGRKKFVNVIATLNPDAPRRLVLACHYDSKLEPTGFLGATDSAVPCSQMINLAYVLDRNLKEHSRTDSDLTLQFIFFDGEEPFRQWQGTDNTYGSRHLAAEWQRKDLLAGMDVMVLLDLLGAKNPNIYSLDPKADAWFRKFNQLENEVVSRDGRMPKAQIFSDLGPRNTHISDDHIPFMKRGVPILHLIAAPFPSQWHTLADNKSAVHPPTVKKLNRILRLFVAQYLSL